MSEVAQSRISDKDLAQRMLETYWPSLGLWRWVELKQLRFLHYEHPIIDIGCGDGTSSSFLFDRVEVGIGISVPLLGKARLTGVYGSLVQWFADRLPYKDGTFETVFSNSLLEHIGNLHGTVKELGRILSPSGKLIITAPTEWLEKYMLFPNE